MLEVFKYEYVLLKLIKENVFDCILVYFFLEWCVDFVFYIINQGYVIDSEI